MESYSSVIFFSGIIILSGFILGRWASHFGLPKVSGYIIAGLLLSPSFSEITNMGFEIIPSSFIEDSESLVSISLAIITFAIGGELSLDKIRSSGKMILTLTGFESLFSYLLTGSGVFILAYLILGTTLSLPLIVVLSLILAALAAPTDPSATLAVKTQYDAKGDLSSSVLGIAAFDDIAGIILFTVSLTFTPTILSGESFDFAAIGLELLKNVVGGIAIGAVFGYLFNVLGRFAKCETEGSLTVYTIGGVLSCYGIAELLDTDAFLATMAFGAMVVNFNPLRKRVFYLLEHYTEELVFVVFFVLSGLHLDLSTINGHLPVILVFGLLRIVGKHLGITFGAKLVKTPDSVRKYAATGLFPQGGIIIGLALLLANDPLYDEISSIIISVIIGSSVIHEILGPLVAKWGLVKAGEIQNENAPEQ